MDCKKSLKHPILHVVQGTAGSFGERGKMVQKGKRKLNLEWSLFSRVQSRT